jgi:hypothetical protein
MFHGYVSHNQRVDVNRLKPTANSSDLSMFAQKSFAGLRSMQSSSVLPLCIMSTADVNTPTAVYEWRGILKMMINCYFRIVLPTTTLW